VRVLQGSPDEHLKLFLAGLWFKGQSQGIITANLTNCCTKVRNAGRSGEAGNQKDSFVADVFVSFLGGSPWRYR
jgi:hypothetical protein